VAVRMSTDGNGARTELASSPRSSRSLSGGSAVMSKHLLVVVQVIPQAAAEWSADEVAVG
jgi:hypothetical protein